MDAKLIETLGDELFNAMRTCTVVDPRRKTASPQKR